MKIVYISNSPIPSREANSVNVMKMCSAFAGNGHDVVLLCRSGESDADNIYSCYGVEDNFKIEKIWWPSIKGGGFIYGILVRKFLKSLTEDCLVYGRDIYGMLPAGKMGFSCIFEAHTPPRNRAHYCMQKKLFKSYNYKRLVTITEALKNRYLKIFPFLDESVVAVAPDGADISTDEWEDRDAEVASVAGNDKYKVGYAGSLYPGKGMEIISKLAEEMPDIEFHVAGGDEKDITYWKEKIRSGNLYFHGFIPHRDLGKYCRSFDVVLAPCQRRISLKGGKGDISNWTSPLKIFEYMACKRPMIVSDLPVIREVLRDGENALLCDPEDIENWKRRILNLKNDNVLSAAIADRAFRELKDKYTWGIRAKSVLNECDLS